MEPSDPIFLLLKKMRLDRHYSKLMTHPELKIKSIDDMWLFLSNPKVLNDIGFTSVEVKRFVRLFEKVLQVTNNSINYFF